jgi:sporulation protein YlmC with PRC-barrel domain
MLHKANHLKGYKLHSINGEIGKVKEFYFDDHHWAVRYLVADTGGWLSDHQVLISPYAIHAINEPQKNIALYLSNQQIEGCPSLESDQPVSKHYEAAYYGYYGWPMYFDGPYLWGQSPILLRGAALSDGKNPGGKAWDPSLRSMRDVTGHAIHATDGEIGHVEDFIIDDETWAIRYLIVSTQNVLPGKKALISPHWIERVSWEDSAVFTSLSRDEIKRSPTYEEMLLVTREYEAGLHRYYGRKGYWLEHVPFVAKPH